MKRRHLLLMALSLIISICMCFALSACSSCDDDDAEPTKLTTPTVTISDEGVASWLEVEHASGYAYVIGDGEETATTKLSVNLTDGQSIKVKAKGDGTYYSDSDFSTPATYTATPQPTKLGTPVVTINASGLASWEPIANSLKYTTKINGVDSDTSDTARQLEDGDTIQVKAVGNGTTFTDSEFSAVQTYNAQAPQPAGVMTHAEFTAAAKDADAVIQGVVSAFVKTEKYGYNIYMQDSDGGYYIYGTVGDVAETFAKGVTIKASGKKDIYNGLNQIKNATIEIVDATAKTVEPTDITETIKGDTDLTTLQGILVIIKGVTVTDVVTASGKTNVTLTLDGKTVTFYLGGSQLVTSDEQTAIAAAFDDVKGKTCDVTAIATVFKSFQLVPANASPISNVQADVEPLDTPSVTLDGAVPSWSAIEGATHYIVNIKASGAADWTDCVSKTVDTLTTDALTDGQSIRVKAIAVEDEETVNESGWSIAKTYTTQVIDPSTLTALPAPTVTVDANGNVSWTKVDGAVGYEYTVTGGEKKETAELGFTPPLTPGQSVTVVAVADMVTAKNSEEATKTYIKKLPNPTVTISLTGEVTVTADANATSVEYVIGEGEAQTYDETHKPTLTNGQKITVTAKGNGTAYSDSDEVEETFTAIPKPVATEKDVQFDFSEVVTKASTTAYTNDAAKTAFDAACKNNADYFSTVTTNSSATPVYPGNGSDEAPENIGFIKFAKSSANGSLTLTFTKDVIKVVIVARAYGTTTLDTPVIIVNGVSSVQLTGEIATYTFDIDASKTVTISSDKAPETTGKTRCFVYSITLTTKNSEIKKPVVSINEYGVATWEVVEGASGYTYSINGEAAQTAPENRTVPLADGDTIVVTAISNSADYDNGVSEAKKFELKQTPLAAPTVSISSKGVASWNAVEHATAYVYKIGENGVEHTITVTDAEQTKYTLSDVTVSVGETIYVMSKGDTGEIKVYLDSTSWKSATFSADPKTLEAPSIAIDKDGNVTVTPSEENSEDDVECIKYYIGDVSEAALAALQDGDWETFVNNDGLEIATNGHGVAVKTLTNNTAGLVLDSEVYSVTYKAPSTLATPAKPEVTVEGNTAEKVIVKITKVENASGYAYVKNGTDVSTAVKLTDDDELENGETETTISYVISLKENATIAIVALGNSATFESEPEKVGDYSGLRYDSLLGAAETFKIDETKSYDVVNMVKIANYYGATAPNRNFIVSGKVVENGAYSTQYNNIDITLADKEETVTFVVFRATYKGNVGSTTTDTNELIGTTVTASGKPFIFEDTKVNPHTFTPEFNSGCTVTSIEWDDNDDRFNKVVSALTVTEHYEENTEVTLPSTLPYGVTLTWSIEYLEEDTTSEAAIVLSDPDDGVYTLTIARQSDKGIATLTATLHYGTDTKTKEVEFTILVDKLTAIEIKTKPVVKIDNDGKATWEAVTNAVKYAYQIVSSTDDFDEDAAGTETNDCFKTGLTLGQIIYVKAIGDGVNYSKSAWSDPVTYKIYVPANATFDFTKSVDPSNAITVDQVTVTFAKNNGSTNPAFNTGNSAIRLYAKGSMTITAGQKYITKIQITCKKPDQTDNLLSADGGNLVAIKDTYNYVWTGSANTVIFTVGGSKGHSKIINVVVTYEIDAEQAIANVPADLENLPDINGTYTTSGSLLLADTTGATSGFAISYRTTPPVKDPEVTDNGNGTFVINEDGTVTIERGDTDTTFIVTATIACPCGNNAHSHTKTYKVIVSAKSNENTTSTLTLDFTTDTARKTFTTTEQKWQANGITLTNTKETSITNANNAGNNAGHIRMYVKSKVTIECDIAFKTITFKCTGSKYLVTDTITNATRTVAENDITYTFTSAVTSFEISSVASQIRCTEIVISA